MTDDFDDRPLTDEEILSDPRAFWIDLLHSTMRLGPRLMPAHGRCPTCRLPATGAREFAGSLFAWCGTCLIRWRITDTIGGLLELDPPAHDDERAFLDLCELAECEEMPGDFDHPSLEIPSAETAVTGTIFPRRFEMRQTTTAPKSYNIDPQRFQKPDEGRLLRPLRERHRILLTDAVIADMVEHPPFERHPITRELYLPFGADEKTWHRVRDLVLDASTGHTFEQLLAADPEVSPFALKYLMQFLGQLRERRRELEEQVRALDDIGKAFDVVLPVEART